MQLLGSIPNLQCLHIKFSMKGSPLHLSGMLNQCPEDIKLKLTMDAGLGLAFAECHNSIYPKIRHLEIIYSRSLDAHLFKHFPALHSLRLTHPPIQKKHLHIILKHCPNVQQLLLGSTSVVSGTEKSLLQPKGLEGLRLISLQGIPLYGDLIGDLMKRHHGTLQAFALQGTFLNSTPVSMLADDPVVFNQLRSLRFPHTMMEDMISLVRWIILRAPNIEYVKSIGGGCVDREILNALIGRPVRSIELECSIFSSEVDIHRFLGHHVQLGAASSLQDVKCLITNPPPNSGASVFPISRLEQLKTLELSLAYLGDEELMEILILLVSRGCSSLEEVTLTFPPFVLPVKWILPLSEHPHLKNLIILSGMIPYDRFNDLECFGHLDLLHLKLRSFDSNAIARLKRKMPHLTCTVIKSGPPPAI